MSTYTPIASVTLSAATSSVTFSSIPQTYTDLILVVNMATSSSSGSDSRCLVKINNDGGANYSSTYINGDGSTAGSSRDTNRVQIDGVVNISSSPNFGQVIYQFQNYSNTTTYKTVLQRGGNLGNLSLIGVGSAVSLWRSTAAVTTLTIYTGGPTPGNFVSGSTFSLYGINAQASAQAKATGGQTIIRDSSYWYHVFTGSGTFTPIEPITADVLIVAGGGAGGGTDGGGGGAGGLRYLTSQSFTSSTTVVIGAGGTAAPAYSQGTNGVNSSVGALSATGGGKGGGGSGPQTFGSAGGSGGGGGGNTSGGSNNYPGGAGNSGGYSPVEGFAGGNGNPTESPRLGGGGGGAGGVGGNGNATPTGGPGVNTYSSIATATLTGVNGYYAGGGGAGGQGASANGGSGGGGNGSGGGNGASGTANTGGGGGGGGNDSGGGAGGSGIVIIRYAV